MKIRIFSDLHLEFEDFVPPKLDSDVIVLAGDIALKTHAIPWAVKYFQDIPVLYVLGNHEFYGTALPKHIGKMKAAAQGTNVIVLENDSVEIADTVFFGCTLWTDFDLFGNGPLAQYDAQTNMTDFRKIKHSPEYRRLYPRDLIVKHIDSKRWLSMQLDEASAKKKVVVTHHAPSIHSIPACYKEDRLSPAYASNLDNFIVETNPNLWIHGHIHDSSDYLIDETRVLCNPRGYRDENNLKFNPQLVVEI